MSETTTYDLVIRNGRVMDPETLLDARRDVGIRNGTIAEISEEPLQGRETIDATGLVVAPGFIDLHTHGQTIPSLRMQACDGVTTALELEAGSLPIGLAYDTAARERRPINYGFSAGWMSARIKVLEDVELDGQVLHILGRYARPEWRGLVDRTVVDQILALVEQGLKEGGLGIGILLGYAPESNHEEYYLLAKLAAKYGVPTFTHLRWASFIEPHGSYEAVAEAIGAAGATGAHMHICHANSSSLRHTDEILSAIRHAQEQGLKITTEMYPYGAADAVIGAAYAAPENLPAMGMEPTDIFNTRTQKWIGSVEELKEIRENSPDDLGVFHFLNEDKPEDRELLDHALAFPGIAIGTDAMPFTSDGAMLEGDVWPLPENASAHPRGAGSFSRILGRYVRERQVISLMEALRRTSLVPAQILEQVAPQMKQKGRLQAGADADITIFDPETVIDRATYESPALTSAGIHHVLVNGHAVVKEQALVKEALPGQPVRGPQR